MLLQFVAITRRLKKIDHLRKSVLGSVGSFNAGRIESGKDLGPLSTESSIFPTAMTQPRPLFPPLLSPFCRFPFVTVGLSRLENLGIKDDWRWVLEHLDININIPNFLIFVPRPRISVMHFASLGCPWMLLLAHFWIGCISTIPWHTILRRAACLQSILVFSDRRPRDAATLVQSLPLTGCGCGRVLYCGVIDGAQWRHQHNLPI